MIDSLQSLRFIFAIMIFFHHYAVNGEGLFPAGGPCGVSFFMILSGFVMSAGYGEKVNLQDFSWKQFIFKRLIRLYPLHILCLLGFICLNFLHLSELDYIKIIPNVVLLQSWIPIRDIYFSGNAVSWCLSDLLFFYAIFPLLNRYLGQLCIRKVIRGIFLTLILYILIVLALPESYYHSMLYISPIFRVIDFYIGMFTYAIYIKIRTTNMNEKILNLSFFSKSIIEIILVLVLMLFISFYSYVDVNFSYSLIWWFIIPELILVFALFNRSGGVISCLLNAKLLIIVGSFSFTFYMIHQMGIGVIRAIINKLSLNLYWPLELFACFIIILLTSYFVYKYYEIPVLKFLKKRCYE